MASLGSFLLLATFVVLIWLRRDAGRPSETPVHVVGRPSPAPSGSEAPPSPPAATPDDAAAREAEERRRRERGAAEAEARKRQEEARREQERLALLADDVARRARELWERNRYDDAENVLRDAVSAEPGLKGATALASALTGPLVPDSG